MMFFDLHRHDEFSFFDGFGKASELAKHAKSIGYDALGISNHGNISGLVKHWKACREVGIKPILGCEVYFQPVFNKENPKRQKFHLCLFVKNYEGYKNLCRLLSLANREQFYYTPVVDFNLLEKYHDGLICTTACIQGYLSQALKSDSYGMAQKFLNRMEWIFGNDLYIEIQPYKIDEDMTQEDVNIKLISIAEENNIKYILTSDSHYGSQDDFDTYCKLHEIAKHDLDWVVNTYSERYMPSEEDILNRFYVMHRYDFGNVEYNAKKMLESMQILKDSIDSEIFEHCEMKFPKTGNENSNQMLIQMAKEGLKKRGKYSKEYIKRIIEEIEVIHHHNFDDYFLMVQEYVNWARNHNIAVGDGRGSACNCLTAYAIGITDVDSVKYNLDFSRFMRKEKKKEPDIDVDFETDRRGEVIEHVIDRYGDQAVRICSYSEYDTDGLINDLAKVCGLSVSKDMDEYDQRKIKETVSDIKKFIHIYDSGNLIDLDGIKQDEKYDEYNQKHDNILRHFVKLYKKVRNLGTHAAGVAVTGGKIEDYTCFIRRTSGKNIYYSSCYDLNDLESIKCLKFDMLGLRTLSEIKELERYTGHKVSENDLEDKKLYEYFREGKTDGIFQMEKSAPKKILSMIHCDDINDVIAVNALNRPAPLQLKMHETFAYNKMSGSANTNSPYYKYTKETYGTMLYQEQTVEVAQKIGHLTPEQSFDLLKIMKKESNLTKPEYIPVIEKMKKDFFKGCRQEKLTKDEASSIWASMLIYGFNKGHSVGYSIIPVKQMYYKVYFPVYYWYVKIKYARNDADFYKFTRLAVLDDCLVFLPHVNYGAKTCLRKEQGEIVIQQGLDSVKNVGSKAAEAIQEERHNNGVFKDRDSFESRCRSQKVNLRVINALAETSALQFNRDKYIRDVIKYNSTMAVRR